ncbi:MAG: hypothetical protein ACKOGA_13005, partial [Planctomycetaceae bacterium]
LSSFAPTFRFGLLMAVLLMATLAGDLLLLPALLNFGRNRREARPEVEPPQFATRSRRLNPSVRSKGKVA